MDYCRRLGLVIVVFLVGTVTFGGGANAQPPEVSSICKIGSIQGNVTAKRHNCAHLESVRLNDTFYPGDRILTGAHSRIAIVLNNDTVLRIDENTTIVFTGPQKKRAFLVELIKGAVHFFSRKARSLKVSTPFVNAMVEGTEFFVKVEKDNTLISLFEGRVLAENAHGSLLLSKGQSVVAHAEQAPRFKTVVQPRDAVQWTLYYPPIIDFDIDGVQRPYAGDLPSKLSQSMAAHRRGNLASAFAIIDGAGEDMADTRFYIYRAGLSLAVGRVTNALADIQRAIDLDADNSQAFALRAIVAVVQNRHTVAYADAQKAVALNPASPTALIALSYVLQARFNLSGAIEAIQSAVKKAPGHAIARARLAELRLSTGDLDGALRAAQRAIDLKPNNIRAHTVLGYAYLTRFEIAVAKESFDKAIEFDSTAPLPRLGLGLAKIRQGDIASGRSDIELAAGLDPGNALIRSYLGKAYFDEKRRPLEARQLEIAKALDPLDPTPWFYDAIRKQTQNRPVEALLDLQKSITLNDNRAVYRSRLLMDEDLAARSASLGRIYSDLGFEELALRQGWRSLQADPSNYSAHRLLADAYSARHRHEIARVSELLQAQLLQPLSVTPVQPQLAESNLLIPEGAGPGSASFNEFNPLFARNRVTAQVDGLAGDNSTWGEEIALSGIYNRISGSAGQYHYETDGFRINNDLEQDIYGAMVQAAITPKVNMQTEYRRRTDTTGDLNFNWKLDEPSATLRQEMESDTLRLGMHATPWRHSDFVASLIYRDMCFTRNKNTPSELEVDSDGMSGELQYINKHHLVDVIAGGGYYDIDRNLLFKSANYLKAFKFQHGNGYVYTYLRYPANMTWTLGFSVDNLNRNEHPDKTRVHPKMGLNLSISKDTMLRLTAFTGLKRSLIADQTIEPTNVAGFNQFFDDDDATEFVFYGAGLDHKFNHHLHGGVELSVRALEHPIIYGNRVLEEDWEENTLRLYLYWTIRKHLSLGADYQYELFKRDERMNGLAPVEMETQIVPLQLSYFHPSGGFGRLTTTLVSQNIEMFDQPGVTSTDEFILSDVSIGYRLPKRHGILSAEIRNVFDQSFNYMDIATRSSQDVITPLFLPERTFVFRFTMSF